MTKEEYLDYSFLKKLKFSRSRNWLWGKLLDADTFLFTPEGKLVGKIRAGFVEPSGWLKIYNADELGRLVTENKISFAFNGGNRADLYTNEVFRYGTGDMYCVVIDGKIFLLNNLSCWPYDDSDDTEFRLIPFEEFIEKNEK